MQMALSSMHNSTMKRVPGAAGVSIENMNSTPGKHEEETTIKHNQNTDDKRELSEAF